MDEIWLTLLFGIGILTQAALFLRGRERKSIKGVASSIAIAVLLGAALVAESEPGNLFYNYPFAFFISFCGIFGIYFRKEILPVISEKNVLSMTLIFWYVLIASNYLFVPRLDLILAIVIVTPTLGVIYLAFTYNRLGPHAKLFFYAWFLITLVSTAWKFFPYESLSLFTDESTRMPGPVDTFLAGMALMYMVAYIAPVLDLITEKHHDDWMENAKILASKYSDEQLKTTTSLIIILVQGGSLAVNHILHPLPESLLISIWILLVPQMTYLVQEIRKGTILQAKG